MRDPIARRRATLLGLVGVCLVLLTASFGEGGSAGGPLGSIQRGFSDVLSPIQEGASRALKPFRDLAGWFGDTLDAKDERDKLKTERDRLRFVAADADRLRRENDELRGMLQLDKNLGIDAYGPETARVIGRTPNLWYATLKINKGSSDGVREGQPVINGEGLVGKVTEATGGSAIVTLVTDQSSGVAATIARRGDAGVLQPAPGEPGDVQLEQLPPRSRVAVGDRVITAGTTSERLPSRFPRGLPIGRVTRVDRDELELFQRVHVRPYADLRRLEFVQVLTSPEAGP